MRIAIAGGSGLLGGAARRALQADGHSVGVLTRRPRAAGDIAWSPDRPDAQWADEVGRADAVINLAGESIAGGRWSARRKTMIRDSRLRATRALVDAINRSGRPVAFLSGSATGYYGLRGDEPLTESSPPGADFLATVCVEWEREALRATPPCRVVLLRTGLVLSRDGGALPQMALPFRFGAGGRAGSGRQYMSWIHIDDWVGLLRLLLAANATGPFNLTAPNPVTNAEFARTLGRALHRPALLPTPGFALRLVLGEMADALLLGGQRVLPSKAIDLGYSFSFPTLASALNGIYR